MPILPACVQSGTPVQLSAPYPMQKIDFENMTMKNSV